MLPSTPLAADFNWATPAFIGELHDAIARRLAVVGLANDPLFTQIEPTKVILNKRDHDGQAGGNRLSETVVDAKTGVDIFNLPIRAMQEAVELLAGNRFYKSDPMLIETPITEDYTGYDLNPVADEWSVGFWTLSQIRTELGLTSGFTRKRPRYIYSLGDAGVLGQRARRASSASLSNVYAAVYEYNGTSWVAITDDPEARPDTIEASGRAEVGDWIGPWIFNELLDFLSYLTICNISLPAVSGETNTQRIREARATPSYPTFVDSTASLSALGTSSGAATYRRNNITGVSGAQSYSTDITITVSPNRTLFPDSWSSTAGLIKVIDYFGVATSSAANWITPSAEWSAEYTWSVILEKNIEEFSMALGDYTDLLARNADSGEWVIEVHKIAFVVYIDDEGLHEP